MTRGSSLPCMPFDWTPPERLVSATSARLIGECQQELRHRGIDGTSCLRGTCRHSHECWASGPHSSTEMSLRLPWIGPSYEAGGVLLVGMNAHTHRGLFDEWFVIDSAYRELQAGRQRFFGTNRTGPSWFHYRAAVVASVLLEHSRGGSLSIPEPREAAEALLSCALLQSVQCSTTSTSRGTPTARMLKHCPTLTAWPFLEILRPARIVLFGSAVRRAFERSYPVVWTSASPLARWGRSSVAQNKYREIYALRHPSSGFGMQSIMALQQGLQREA